MADLNIKDYNGIIGNPVNPYQQAYDDTCAIKSQQLILNEFGIPVTEDQLVQYSMEHGWYNGNGTSMSDVGKLIADAGIPCTQHAGANRYDLTNELIQGHKVIVAVDSGELWDNGILDWLKDIFVGDTPDHALIVAGIDNTDPKNPMVILTDPGTGQPTQPYPLDQFMDAWSDSGCYMVTTDVPTPTAVENFEMNGMTDMHLPEVAGVDYNSFQNFQAYSHLIEPTMLPDLYCAFQAYPMMPTQDFNMIIQDFGLPYYDTAIYPSASMVFDPMNFDYSGLGMGWLGDTFSTPTVTELETAAHSYDVLTDLHQDALDHAQQCIDNGMYSSAQMWTQQASNIQSDINNLPLFNE